MIASTPLPIARYLNTVDLESRPFAFVGLDELNAVTTRGGGLEHFGLESIVQGELILEKYAFLEGLLPGDNEPVVIHNTQFENNQFVDLHLFTDLDGQWILFVDNTESAKEDQAAQQERLDIDLLKESRKV